jgi:hypothetical protein
MSHCVQEQPDTLDLDEPVILTIAQKQMMPSITCGTDLVFHRETRSTMDASKPEPNHGPDGKWYSEHTFICALALALSPS